MVSGCQEIIEKGISPEAVRMYVLESHYRTQAHFTWEGLEAAQNRLNNWQALADLRWQAIDDPELTHADLEQPQLFIKEKLAEFKYASGNYYS